MHLAFSHPDYTVGIGIAPIRGKPQPVFLRRLRKKFITAGEDFHLAPKNIHFSLIISPSEWTVNSFLFCIFDMFIFTIFY